MAAAEEETSAAVWGNVGGYDIGGSSGRYDMSGNADDSYRGREANDGFDMGSSGGGFGGFHGGNQFHGESLGGLIQGPSPYDEFRGRGGGFPSFGINNIGGKASADRAVTPQSLFEDNVNRPNLEGLAARTDDPTPPSTDFFSYDSSLEDLGIGLAPASPRR